MVVPDPSLVARRAAGRLDAAHQPRRGERVQRLVDRLQGHVAHPGPHPFRDPVDAEVVAVPDGLEQRDADGRHPQAGTAQCSTLGSSSAALGTGDVFTLVNLSL